MFIERMTSGRKLKASRHGYPPKNADHTWLCSSMWPSSSDRFVFYCRTTSASIAPGTSRRTCCPTHCASYCALCQPLLRAFSGWIRSPPPAHARGLQPSGPDCSVVYSRASSLSPPACSTTCPGLSLPSESIDGVELRSGLTYPWSGNSDHGTTYMRVGGDDGELRPWHYIYE